MGERKKLINTCITWLKTWLSIWYYFVFCKKFEHPIIKSTFTDCPSNRKKWYWSIFFFIFAYHFYHKLEPHSLSSRKTFLENFLFSKYDWKISLKGLKMESSQIFTILVLIISCLWALFGLRFLTIFLLLSLKKSIVNKDSITFWKCCRYLHCFSSLWNTAQQKKY